MRWVKRIFDSFHAYKLWFFILIGTDLLFIFLAWLAYPDTFYVLIGVMIAFTFGMLALAFYIMIRRQSVIENIFQDFIGEPTEINEERLCRVSPKTDWPRIRKIGRVLRDYEERLNEQKVELVDYENYIEGWVHEIKKPISLLTLVLDNRSEEMSNLVRKRLFHIRDQMYSDVERILYYARLGATHKDYLFEPINLMEFCKQTVEEYQTMIEESGFHIFFKGDPVEVVSDRKGLAFILAQIIANSTKHAAQYKEVPSLTFEVEYNEEHTTLHIYDNGPGVAPEDLPFIFDKGFTGGRGTYTREATGMGLFLVRKMANDLAIQVEASSELGDGLCISLIFPNVIKEK